METQGLIQPFLHYDISNRTYVHETSRPIGTSTCFTSFGDDISSPMNVGGGTPMKIVHKIGDPLEQSIYVDGNFKLNRTFAHEGYIVWKNADFDEIKLETVPTLTLYSAGVSTNYNIVNGVIVPAAGDGTIVVEPQDIKLVEMPLIEMGNGARPTAFWNADHDPNTNTFSNITAAPQGNGVYNMFASELILNRFVDVILVDNGFLMLQSSDNSEIGHGMRMKFIMITSGEDHDWKGSCILTLHRERTA